MQRPSPAKFELLVRRDDDEDFELRQVASVVGYLNSRPRRVDEGSYEISELRSRLTVAPGFILKNKTTDRFLLLSAQERFLWDQMDGATALQEIATAYVLKYGEFDFEIIPSLLRKLQRAQLLTFEPRSRLRAALARNRGRVLVKALEFALTALERIRISSHNVQPFFQALYRYGGFLVFTPVAAIACVLLAVVGAGAAHILFRDVRDMLEGFGGHALRGILTVKLLFFASVALHQFVHGLACIHYRRRVREFGFTFLHGFVPTFYIDVTDIFMASRRARFVTAATGALVHLVLLFHRDGRLPRPRRHAGHPHAQARRDRVRERAPDRRRTRARGRQRGAPVDRLRRPLDPVGGRVHRLQRLDHRQRHALTLSRPGRPAALPPRP